MTSNEIFTGIVILMVAAYLILLAKHIRYHGREKEEGQNLAPEQVETIEDSFKHLSQAPTVVDKTSSTIYQFRHGELKELVLKYIKNRKGITFIKLGALIPNVKDNSLRKCLSRLKREGLIESRRIGKTRFVGYFLKKSIDTVTEE